MKYVLIGLLALGLLVTAAAADTQPAYLAGTVSKSITVTLDTNSLSFGTMVAGENPSTPAYVTVTGTVGGTVNSWQIVLQDNNQGAGSGYMFSGATPLGTGLEAKTTGAGPTPSFTYLWFSNPMPIISGATTSKNEFVYFEQNLLTTDPAGTYTIQVNFIGTVLS